MMKELLKILENDEPISFFLGAGVSIGPKGLGSGADLAKHLSDKFSLPDASNMSLMSVCDECSFINESRFRDTLREYLQSAVPQNTHTLLAEIVSILEEPKDFLLTVNVDDLLETEYRNKKGKPLTVAKKSTDIYSGGPKTYIKIHGCVTDINEAVFTTKDYLTIDQENRIYEKLTAVFAERSIVFIGFSLQDIDILRLLYKVCPTGGFKKPHFWINPTGPNWSEPRANYYLKQFNVYHINLDAAGFLEQVLECLQKKKDRSSLIQRLVNSKIDDIIPVKIIEALIEIANCLNEELQVKLLYKCLLSKPELQINLYKNWGNVSKSLERINDVLKLNPMFSTQINLALFENNAISFQKHKSILSSLSDFSIPSFYNLILSIDAFDDAEWITLVFGTLEDNRIWAKVMDIFNKDTRSALIGLMKNINIDVLMNIQKNYRGKDECVNLLLLKRIDQLNGVLIESDLLISSEFSDSSAILVENNNRLRDKYRAVWINTKCDEKNTCRTNFLTNKKLNMYKKISLDDSELERALIGTGLVLVKNQEKTFIHLIGQNIELDLDVCNSDFVAISHERILCFEDDFLYFYDFNGVLLKMQPIYQKPIISPKVVKSGVCYFVGADQGVYRINNDNEIELLFTIQTNKTVNDLIICDNLFALAVETKVIIRNNDSEMIEVDCGSIIKCLVSDDISIYTITRERIVRFSLNDFSMDGNYNIVADIHTSIVALSNGILVYGNQNRIVSINFNSSGVVHNILLAIEEEEELLDLIYCDAQLIAIGKSGSIYFIDYMESKYVSEVITDPANKALISAGSGVICIRTENALLLCRNIA